MPANTAVPGSGCPARAGTGSALVTAARLVPHSSGELAPAPRGSKLTTSMLERTSGGSSGYSTGRIWLPLSPGPPGFMTSVPLVARPPVAAIRVTAICRVPAEGSA